MLRIHYVDEGPAAATETVLCLHGEPSWSYLYRFMIPVFVKAGYRVIAPDLVGFGKSDKPSERAVYSYARHVGWLTEALFAMLGLTNLTLVCQDWGGLLGLRLVAEQPERFARVVAANTGLPTGYHLPSEAFFRWRHFSQTVPEMPIGDLPGSLFFLCLSHYSGVWAACVTVGGGGGGYAFVCVYVVPARIPQA